jgi:hypothetical protein
LNTVKRQDRYGKRQRSKPWRADPPQKSIHGEPAPVQSPTEYRPKADFIMLANGYLKSAL